MEYHSFIIVDQRDPHVINEEDLSDESIQAWGGIKELSRELSVYWLPLAPWGEPSYGIWFERWQDNGWDEKSGHFLSLLSQSYTAAFERVEPRTFFNRAKQKIVNRKRLWGLALCVLIAVLFWRVPLRVVAPCEIVPEDPYLVTAPLNGVISEVVVDSGADVARATCWFPMTTGSYWRNWK